MNERKIPDLTSPGRHLLNSSTVKNLDEYASLLLSAGLAGTKTSHGSKGNLDKIDRLLNGDPKNTFGLERLLKSVEFEEAYEAATEQIGNPPDKEENPGRGCIDPTRTAAGLVKAGERIRETAESSGKFVFATGHPGAMLLYYLGLNRWVGELGAEALTVETDTVYKRGSYLDWMESVAVLGDRASLLHSHEPKPMQEALEKLGPVDLVVADHGFAGAAIAKGIPTIAVMDTNDPALAVVAGRGAEGLTIIPIDDNRPPNSYAAALEVIKSVS
ncbi:phosphatase [soil metagenome]